MTKTFNRQPIVVDTPSSSDAKQYFFNHSNWKGLTDNKNILSIDQETFVDANNVYVDKHGVLASRPALKYSTTNVIDVWSFSNISAVLVSIDRTFSLVITYNNNTYSLTLPTDNIKVILYNNRLLIFSPMELWAFNLSTTTFENGAAIVHIPITKIHDHTAILDKDGDKNELSESEIYVYLYSMVSNNGHNKFLVNDKIYNNTVYMINPDNDEKWYFTFTENTKKTIVEQHNLSNLEINSSHIDYQRSSIGTSLLTLGTFIVYYSVDGLHFDKLDFTSLAQYERTEYFSTSWSGIKSITLSEDGYHIAVLTEHNAYIKSIVNNSIDFYLEWTPLLDKSFKPCNHIEYGDNATIEKFSNANTSFTHVDKITMYSSTCFAIAQTVESSFSSYIPDANTYDYTGYATYLYYKTGDKSGTAVVNDDAWVRNDNAKTLQVPITSLYDVHTVKLAVNPDVCAVLYIGHHSEFNVSSSFVGIYNIDDENELYPVTEIEAVPHDGTFGNDIAYCKNINNVIYAITRSSAIGNASAKTVICRYRKNDIFIRYTKLDKLYNHLRITDSLDFYSENGYLSIATGTEYKYSFGRTYSLVFPDGDCVLLFRYDNKNQKYIVDSSRLTSTIELYEEVNFSSTHTPKVHSLLPTALEINNQLFISQDNTLYISSSMDDKLYFPKIQTQTFDNVITGLHTISDKHTAIFFEDGVYYALQDDSVQVGTLSSVYRYYKTKLPVGLLHGGTILTSFDGKYSIFPTRRGLAAMTYQNYVATEDQVLSYLSDEIYDRFDKYLLTDKSFNKIQLFKHAFWIFVYKNTSNVVYVFDIRNNSWWSLQYFGNIQRIVEVNNELQFLINNTLYVTKPFVEVYCDDINSDKQQSIEWFIKSQRLHLSALNYDKHIKDIVFTSVHDVDELSNTVHNVTNVDMNLKLTNYRRESLSNTNNCVSISYKIANLTSHTQKLNYFNVSEFEYVLSSNEENAIDIPLRLSSITIRYKISKMR